MVQLRKVGSEPLLCIIQREKKQYKMELTANTANESTEK